MEDYSYRKEKRIIRCKGMKTDKKGFEICFFSAFKPFMKGFKPKIY